MIRARTSSQAALASLLLLVLAACSASSSTPAQGGPTSYPCGNTTCSNGEICAIVLGSPACQPPPDCQVICTAGDGGGVPNGCGLGVCPDETLHNKVSNPGATTCSGRTGTGVTVNCAYN